MSTVTLSNEYQLVFPEEIRETTGIKAGTSFEIILYNNRIELIPIKPIRKRAYLRGSITIYEVFKKLLYERNEDDALFAIAHMRQGKIIELTDELSLFAAKTGKDYKLPLADSIIYATTMNYGGTLWTQDKHFMGLESVRYFAKQNR